MAAKAKKTQRWFQKRGWRVAGVIVGILVLIVLTLAQNTSLFQGFVGTPDVLERLRSNSEIDVEMQYTKQVAAYYRDDSDIIYPYFDSTAVYTNEYTYRFKSVSNNVAHNFKNGVGQPNQDGVVNFDEPNRICGGPISGESTDIDKNSLLLDCETGALHVSNLDRNTTVVIEAIPKETESIIGGNLPTLEAEIELISTIKPLNAEPFDLGLELVYVKNEAKFYRADSGTMLDAYLPIAPAEGEASNYVMGFNIANKYPFTVDNVSGQINLDENTPSGRYQFTWTRKVDVNGVFIQGGDQTEYGAIDITVIASKDTHRLTVNTSRLDDGAVSGVAYNPAGTDKIQYGVNCSPVNSDGEPTLTATSLFDENFTNFGPGNVLDVDGRQKLTTVGNPYVRYKGVIDLDTVACPENSEKFVALRSVDRIGQERDWNVYSVRQGVDFVTPGVSPDPVPVQPVDPSDLDEDEILEELQAELNEVSVNVFSQLIPDCDIEVYVEAYREIEAIYAQYAAEYPELVTTFVTRQEVTLNGLNRLAMSACEFSAEELAAALEDEAGPGAGVDTDSDGVVDADDNCVFVANVDQADTDGDNVGDECDRHLFNAIPANLDLVVGQTGETRVRVEELRIGDGEQTLDIRLFEIEDISISVSSEAFTAELAEITDLEERGVVVTALAEGTGFVNVVIKAGSRTVDGEYVIVTGQIPVTVTAETEDEDDARILVAQDSPNRASVTTRKESTFAVINIRREGDAQAEARDTIAYHKYSGIDPIANVTNESDEVLAADTYACQLGQGCAGWSSGAFPVTRTTAGDNYYYRATFYFVDGDVDTVESERFSLTQGMIGGSQPPTPGGLCDPRLIDVPGNHPYCVAISAVYDLGVLQGGVDPSTGQRFYRPDEIVSRAEFVAIARRLAGINLIPCASPAEWSQLGYADSAIYAADLGKAWMCNELKSLQIASGDKIVSGYILPGGVREIRLLNPVEGPQVVKVFLEALDFGRLLNGPLPVLNQVAAGVPWYDNYLRFVAANGVPMNNLGPVTRAEVADFIYRGQRLFNEQALANKLNTAQ